MHLRKYLKEHSISAADFARAVGVAREHVYQWTRGDKLPQPERMTRIYEATNGLVTPNDFYPLPSLPAHPKEAGGR